MHIQSTFINTSQAFIATRVEDNDIDKAFPEKLLYTTLNQRLEPNSYSHIDVLSSRFYTHTHLAYIYILERHNLFILHPLERMWNKLIQ